VKLLRSLLTTSGLTFVSRIFGLLRDMVIASVFGAGMATDAFFVAFRIPNILRRFSAEGAFSQAFVPIFNEYRLKRSQEETHTLLSVVATAMALVLALLCVLVFSPLPTSFKSWRQGCRMNPCTWPLPFCDWSFPTCFLFRWFRWHKGF